MESRSRALVAERVGGAALYRSPHGWRLLNSETGVYSDGWMSMDSYSTFFRPGGPGLVLEVDLSRTAYNAEGPPGHAVDPDRSVRDRQARASRASGG